MTQKCKEQRTKSDYFESSIYYTVYYYDNDGNRHIAEIYLTKERALLEARKYANWQIEATSYLTNLL